MATESHLPCSKYKKNKNELLLHIIAKVIKCLAAPEAEIGAILFVWLPVIRKEAQNGESSPFSVEDGIT